MVISGVSGQYCSCAPSISMYWDPAPQSNCNIACDSADHNAQICGGTQDYWNLAACYTHMHLGSLAVDPWRGILFNTVSVNWYKLANQPYVDGELPER
jgi:hypothetical protein